MSQNAHGNPADIQVSPASGYFGAHVSGVRLGDSLDEPTFTAVRRALDRYRVLFFRRQFLTHAQQTRLARRFGPLAPPHPWQPPAPDHPFVHRLITGAGTPRTPEERHRARWRSPGFLSGWHADITAAVDPPSLCVLRAERVTSRGGDTTWADLVTAYEQLSAPLRRLVDELTAEHRYLVGYVPFGVLDTAARTAQDAGLVAHHPVVRVLPESGLRALFVNPAFTSHINELAPPESRYVLDLLFAHLTRPEFGVRHHWEAGDVAIWDNRATAHLAPEDHEHLGEEREMYRVFVAGSPAVGPDGRTSTALSGERYQATDRPEHQAADDPAEQAPDASADRPAGG
ncbi:TauD/TfdA dioxygenase family protein [Streptomyces phaeofaciens]|uniref:TauD/TfdA dioxygenase family protein n=1 Tax=Streptomyces phaeofaciens TaxID=68254 RepID=UPI00368AE286